MDIDTRPKDIRAVRGYNRLSGLTGASTIIYALKLASFNTSLCARR